MIVAVTGASGFIGEELIAELKRHPEMETIIGLSRSKGIDQERLTWRACDIYSMLELEKGLEGCDVAVYLVHSMLSSSGLSQGTFADFDLILADNFARICVKHGIQHIVYLSGYIPPQDELSPHLRSRREVEKVFLSSSVPTTIVRAGLIVGVSGSSFQIMLRLVKRLPFMICPKWTGNLCQPIAVSDVARILCAIVLAGPQPEKPGQDADIIEIGGPTIKSYMELMRDVSQELGKKRLFIRVPFFSLFLSRLWVSLIAQAPKNLVYPLIQSLKYSMVATKEHPRFPFRECLTFEQTLKHTFSHSQGSPKRKAKMPSAFKKRHNLKTVRSVQRLYLPPGWTAYDAAVAYMHWLGKRFKIFLRVRTDHNHVFFHLLWWKKPLLVLVLNDERSDPSRQLFYIRGGSLWDHHAGQQYNPRIEFRELTSEQVLIAAVHDYVPALPWFLYKVTQAYVHLFVMNRFNQYLKKFL